MEKAEDALTGPRGKLITTIRLMREPRSYYDSLFKAHGDPCLLRAMNGSVVFTGKAEGAREVFSHAPDSYDPFATEASAPLVGKGSLFSLAGEAHKRERKLLRPPFHGARMKGMGEVMARSAREHMSRLVDGEEFVAQDVMMKISLEVIIRVIFGATEQQEVDQLTEAIDDLLNNLNPLVLFSPKLQIAPLGLGPWAKFLARKERLDALIYDRIERHREDGEGGDDILSMLMAAEYEDGSKMSDEALRDELMTLLFAGHETTAISLSWALYHLHRSPDKLATLREELAAESSTDPVVRSKLPYLGATCKETLRIAPIITDIIRTLNEPLDILGVHVEAGWCVGVSVVTIHADPELYPEPDTFDPQRFLDRSFSPFEYMPFGGGHRRCIGAAFASFEMAIILDVLLSEFDLSLEEPDEVVPVRRNITMAPSTGVRMKRIGAR